MLQLNLLSRQRDHAKALKYQDRMLDLLSDGQWWKGKVLCAVLHTNERVIRQIASASGGRILSGQHGYRLTRFASLDEITHAENWYRSQAREMMRRSLEIRKARAGYNGLQGAA